MVYYFLFRSRFGRLSDHRLPVTGLVEVTIKGCKFTSLFRFVKLVAHNHEQLVAHL